MKRFGGQGDPSWENQGRSQGTSPTNPTRLRLIQAEINAVVLSHPLLRAGKSDSCCVSHTPRYLVQALDPRGAYPGTGANLEAVDSEKLNWHWTNDGEKWGWRRNEVVVGHLACDPHRCGNGSEKDCMNFVCVGCWRNWALNHRDSAPVHEYHSWRLGAGSNRWHRRYEVRKAPFFSPRHLVLCPP